MSKAQRTQSSSMKGVMMQNYSTFREVIKLQYLQLNKSTM